MLPAGISLLQVRSPPPSLPHAVTASQGSTILESRWNRRISSIFWLSSRPASWFLLHLHLSSVLFFFIFIFLSEEKGENPFLEWRPIQLEPNDGDSAGFFFFFLAFRFSYSWNNVQQIHFCFAIYSRHRSNEYFSKSTQTYDRFFILSDL